MQPPSSLVTMPPQLTPQKNTHCMHNLETLKLGMVTKAFTRASV
jgi:hypothetical protein